MTTDCIVHTKLGVVRGQKKNSNAFSKKKYYSFLGIPYAKPPIGNLRFKDPQPPESWNGVLKCLEDPPICPQNHIVFRQFLGDEDCLKLNVFSPQLLASPPRPVMVFLHGGAFTYGSGNTDIYGPDYLIEQDIVLVTVNYRVGALGFLSLENSDVPGNAGLKDQSMALRWVQQNITAFGGDPKNVTLFGESAGGVSCHLQMLSPLSRGLYHRVIIQSGSCLNPWTLSMHGKKRSLKLAEVLGCKTEDPVEAIEFLRKVSPEEIIKNQFKVLMRKETACLSFPFVPVIEVPGTGNNFLTKHPKVALQEGDFAHVPLIIGLNSKEGLIVMNDLVHTTEYFQELSNDIGRLISPNTGLPENNLENTLRKIKNYYFGEKELNWDTLNPYLDFVGDITFSVGIDQALRIQLEKASVPIYLYQVTYEGPRPLFKTLISTKYPDKPNLPGVAHADELGYLFYPSILNLEDLLPGSMDETMTSRFTRMWCEFAKTGTPNAPGLGAQWEACERNKICYLEIGEKLEMRNSRIFEDRMLFWDSLLNFPLKQKL